MQVTIAITGPTQVGQEDILVIEVSPETSVGNLKERIEFQSGYAVAKQIIIFEGKPLGDDSRTMQNLGVSAESMLGMLLRPPQSAAGPASGTPARAPTNDRQGISGGQRDPGVLERQRLGYLNNPAELANLKTQLPRVADAVQDPVRWRETLQNLNVEAEKQREFEALEADPFNVEAQKRVEELIRLDRVAENYENTYEYHPEAFGRVHMLYIDVEVNSIKVKAFVDSGAQATIMSPDCATKCNIMRLLDTRFGGIARGVGTAKILGRVHSAPIKVGSSYLPCAFTVMEGKDVDLLLGLDMLKRYQACIDLRKGALLIQGDEVPFLGQADLPTTDVDEPMVDGPAGVKTGAISGAVVPSGTGEAPESTPPSTNPPSGTNASQHLPSVSDAASFPATDIAKLVDMGFSREEAIQALTIAGGDVDGAAGFLL